MTKESREAYLIALGRQVTRDFGPGYYREFGAPVISEEEQFQDCYDMRPEIQKNNGREYYMVTFLYDPSKETLEWNFASQVEIWKDTGEPMGVIFGNGYGINFFFRSYQRQLRSIKRKIIPYSQAATRKHP
jgi:hypothetical protein